MYGKKLKLIFDLSQIKINIYIYWILIYQILNFLVYAEKLPECKVKDSKCTIKSTKSYLKKSTYCISSSTIYVGINSSNGECDVDKDYMSKPGNYFFNSDYSLMRSANTITAGYKCLDFNGSNCEEMNNGMYINSVSNTHNFIIYYDPINTALNSKNIFIDIINQYYINSGAEREPNKGNIEYPILKCDNTNCKAISINDSKEGFFINYGDSTKSSLIQCDKIDCFVESSPKVGYYINGDMEDIQHPLIHCNESQGICNLKSLSSIDPGFYVNTGDNENKSIIQCNSNGCIKLTLSINLNPGYYINIGDSNAPIITCNQNECFAGPDLGTKKKGSYQYINNSLKFRYIDNDIIGCDSDLDFESLYFTVELEADSFPGITSTTETLFKISKSSISQIISDSYFTIGKSDLKLKKGDLEVDGDINLYQCSKANRKCSVITSCVDNSFILNSQNHIAFYCSNNKIYQVTTDGYYIDGGTIVNNNTPYIISCNKGLCNNISSPLNYYINAGVNYESLTSTSSPYSLIYCTKTNCVKTKASVGYYVTTNTSDNIHINRGVIHCQSSTLCIEYKCSLASKYYINSGADNNINALIRCYNNNCNTVKISNGFFLSDNTSKLIFCKSTYECSMVDATSGYYPLSDINNNKNIIVCSNKTDGIYCEIQNASTGFYVSNQTGYLIDCMSNDNICESVVGNDGIYRSAVTNTVSYVRNIDDKETFSNSTYRSSFINDSNDQYILTSNNNIVNNINRATNNNMAYNLILCQSQQCKELSASELNDIPYCTFNNNKCFVSKNPLINGKTITHVSGGEYCTNYDRSVLYLATDEIDLETDIIDVTLSTYTYTTTTTNCIIVSKKYSKNYIPIVNQIFRVNDGQILRLTTPGYYFINTETYTLISQTKEEYYNNVNTKLFKCNSEKCIIVDKPDSVAYYTDVNKHIIQYDPDNDKYIFPYSKDIICIYKPSRCIPKYDLNNNEFCITYKGELALVSDNILALESGNCFRSSTISSTIYGLYKYFYEMDSNSAKRIVTSGFYIVDYLTNSSINYNSFSKLGSSSLILYGCIEHQCNIYEPEENAYYYDALSKNVLKYENGIWRIVENQGYSFININPKLIHIHQITKSINHATVNIVYDSGFYYTIDNNMYECKYNSEVKDITCQSISDNNYYLTNDDKIYYCIYDSENHEKTSCIQQLCYAGQYYFFNGKYYKCGKGSTYIKLTKNSCQSLDTVVINYPTFLKDTYPTRVKMMLEYMYETNISDIVNNNNSSYIPTISGVFDSCQYDDNEDIITFNLICLKNFVLLSSVNPPQICSIRRMGYVECKEDEENPGRCHPDSAPLKYNFKKNFIFIIITLIIFKIIL
ncbi:hypothetical protein BCR32DRAFT_293827 [Anaeromyces robustus]|uniref:Scaffoldin n=1 Tax=Anaeromyces robustus TaxID=1754192 RepID=A0A1Y1X3V2_9FUNG|nr:hypothetical protein BCR32DRAFT_293827 [Anaeromyces robustus]|eukprot:ORX80489.1 hypothetical protein BCR32DRAFT_293827 [Anaeromyces robustus]